MKHSKYMDAFPRRAPEEQPMRQAEPSIPCVDMWPLDQMTDAVRGAYDALAKRGEILVQKITVKRRDSLVIMEYLSTLPQDWTRQALKKEKEALICG